MAASDPVRLGAVLLAGGASRRFGAANKLLADVDGVSLLGRVAREIVAAGVDDIVVVTGAERAAYDAALAGLAVRCVHNDGWERGLGSSIATGVKALAADDAAAFVVPGDLPNITAAMLGRLAAAFSEARGVRIVVPVTAQGAQRNPVLWPRRFFPALAALTGDRGGKSILDSHGQDRLDVAFDDAALFADVDTPDDHARLRAGGRDRAGEPR